jgi:ABC-type nitrate/sulfonate/bicarbonate transport system permease component
MKLHVALARAMSAAWSPVPSWGLLFATSSLVRRLFNPLMEVLRPLALIVTVVAEMIAGNQGSGHYLC